YTPSLHDALPIFIDCNHRRGEVTGCRGSCLKEAHRRTPFIAVWMYRVVQGRVCISDPSPSHFAGRKCELCYRIGECFQALHVQLRSGSCSGIHPGTYIDALHMALAIACGLMTLPHGLCPRGVAETDPQRACLTCAGNQDATTGGRALHSGTGFRAIHVRRHFAVDVELKQVGVVVDDVSLPLPTHLIEYIQVSGPQQAQGVLRLVCWQRDTSDAFAKGRLKARGDRKSTRLNSSHVKSS